MDPAVQALITQVPTPKIAAPPQAKPIPAPDFQRGPADMTDMYLQYPALRGLFNNLTVIDKRSGGMQDDRQLEWYPPNERDNPHPGTYTSEIFNPTITNRELPTAIAADALHGLKITDPQYAQMRQKFGATLTPRQHEIDQRAYAEAGEQRPFNQWMEDSRLDAYLRGYMFPDKADEWRKGGMYTPEQQQELEQMRTYLRTMK
jgi:hypothetical protein